MTIPISTTTVSVLRSDQDGTVDDYDTPTWTAVQSGVRAVIGSHSGTETNAGGSSSTTTARLDADPIGDLAHDDRIYDESTGLTWHVIWVAQRSGLGLDHTVADLILVTDRAGV